MKKQEQITEEQKELVKPAPAPGITAPDSMPKTDEKPFVSAGAKIHNEFTYRFVDWIVNSAVAIGFAYTTSQTKFGQEWFTQPLNSRFEKLLKPLFKSQENLQKGAGWGTKFVSIMFGGTAIIPVMMGLENKKNKKGIIHWLDEKIYGKEKVESDPRFAEQDKAIDEEPKKKFSTGMWARIGVLAPLIAISVSPFNDTIKSKIYDKVAAVTKMLGEKIGLKMKSLNTLAVGGLKNADGSMETKWDYIHGIAAFDFTLTFVYSFMHEAAYKALAAFGFKRHEEHPKSAPAITAPHKTSDTLNADKAFLESAGISGNDAADIQAMVDESKKQRSFATQAAKSEKPKARSFQDMAADKNSEVMAGV